jgi:hypothetical protein
MTRSRAQRSLPGFLRSKCAPLSARAAGVGGHGHHQVLGHSCAARTTRRVEAGAPPNTAREALLQAREMPRLCVLVAASPGWVVGGWRLAHAGLWWFRSHQRQHARLTARNACCR